jgi:dTDP-4-dehydrorhamnose 3,5-epimerase-like enzyme
MTTFERLAIPDVIRVVPAHGFCILAPDTRVAYKVDADYAKAEEGARRKKSLTVKLDRRRSARRPGCCHGQSGYVR